MTRKEKLALLIQERYGDNQTAFALAIGRSVAQVNQWRNGYRNLGDAGARHIEITLGLPQGWFDSPTGLMGVPVNYGDDAAIDAVVEIMRECDTRTKSVILETVKQLSLSLKSQKTGRTSASG